MADLYYFDRHEETMTVMSEASVIDGDAPETVNHPKVLNPFASMYGEEWENKILKTVQLKIFVGTWSLVWHMYTETKKRDPVRAGAKKGTWCKNSPTGNAPKLNALDRNCTPTQRLPKVLNEHSK
eukprot:1802746-Ditylum_brightwellii.AAC.1